MRKSKEMDLTTGSIMKKMIIYSVPFIFTNILQVLFNAADIAVLGIFAGDTAVAAVGASSSLTILIVGLFVGLSIGTNVVLARYVGAKDKEGASRTVGTSIVIAFLSGIALMVLGLILAPWFLRIMDCAESVIEDATTYLRIYFIGAPSMLLYNFSASVLRSVGDTRRPLIFLSISGAVNVGLNILFVLVFKMTVEGVAIATIVSQTISAICCLTVLFKSKGYARLRVRYLKVFGFQLKEIAVIGIPSGLQSVAFNIANVIIQKTINGFDEEIGMAANTAAQQFDAIVYNVGNAISMSCMAFIGQNIGAKNAKNIKKVILYAILLVVIFQFSVGLIFGILAPALCSLIASGEKVIQMASVRLRILGYLYFMCGVMEVFANSNRAMGRPIVSLIISVMGATVFRIAFLKIMMHFFPYFATIYWSYPASWIITIICYLIFTPITYKKTKIAIEGKPL
ncbi:MAG: MATE family efflux transporter [Clostridia bacterium]|nr:MATE family efflux transporter [Clostridia bacterium]